MSETTPERHLLRLERYPAQDAVLTIDGQPCRVVRLKVTPDVTEILYESEARIAAPDCQGDETARPAPEFAAAMAETRQLRDLAAEILATFGPPARPGAVRWTAKQVAGWRKRAGIGDQ